jgi:hypothetical protein
MFKAMAFVSVTCFNPVKSKKHGDADNFIPVGSMRGFRVCGAAACAASRLAHFLFQPEILLHLP